MPFIDRSVIEEIKLRCNIEEVISAYVTLKRSGSNYVGLCPFHSEKSPSFTVFANEGNFYCFGCGAGGDVINFIRKAENIDYPSAVELLAKRVGISVTRTDSERIENDRRERTVAMNRDAARFFSNVLLNTPEGKPGLDYLLSRGLSIPLIRHFGLGFAPNDFDSFPKYMKGKGYSDKELSDGYLVRMTEKTHRPFSLFRNRVIFPIISTTGDVLAFGGRVMDDSKPKYLNSSDTPAFKKSKNLFALNFAKSSSAEQMILCEGYMDVIALHGAGFTNAVATLGTAITPEQARVFKRYTKSVIICYDADEAGQNAASKAFSLLGEVGVDCKILKVKNAKDPDEYIKKYGGAAFKKLMEGSKSEFDFRFDRIRSKYDIEVPEEKLKAIDETVNLISGVSSAARRDVYIFTVAPIFGITPEALKRDVERAVSSKSRLQKRDETKSMMMQSAGYLDRVNPDAVKNIKAARAEEAIIGILLIHPEYLAELKANGQLPTEDEFVTGFGKKVYALMLEYSESGQFDESVLGQSLSVDEIARLSKLRLERASLVNNTTEVLLSCIESLRKATADAGLDINELINSKRKNK